MKYLLLIVFAYNYLFSMTISCKGDLKAPTIYDFSELSNSSTLTFIGEVFNDVGVIDGELDVVNGQIEYYDDRSAICGGELNYNRKVYAYCNDSIFDGCWDVKLGIAGYESIVKKDGVYTNNIIVSDNNPCLPYNVNQVTIAIYDYDNNDVGLANYYLNTIFDEEIIKITEKEAKLQRSVCKKDESIVPYINDWEQLLINQRNILNEKGLTLTSKIFDFSLNLKDTNEITNSLDLLVTNSSNSSNNDSSIYDNVIENFNINPSINKKINSFQENVKNIFSSFFSKYSNVFGFSGYGSAPSSINFSLLGRNYTAFDITLFNEYIPMIRKTLISFSYLWGFILVARSLK